MAISEVQVANYIRELDIEKGSDVDLMFNKLTLIESTLFKDVIEKLIGGEITVNNLLSLSTIDNDSIETFLMSSSTEVSDIVTKRNHYKDKLNDSPYNFKDMKQYCMKDPIEGTGFSDKINEYIHRKFIDSANYITEIELDTKQEDSEKFHTYSELEIAYLQLLTDSQTVQDKYTNFTNLHTSFTYSLTELKDMVDLAMNNTLFIKGNFTNTDISSYPKFSFILNSIYGKYEDVSNVQNFISPSIFDSYYRELIIKMAERYDDDSTYRDGWIVLSDEVTANVWTDLETSADFTKDFNKLQLTRYYYPKMYIDTGLQDIIDRVELDIDITVEKGVIKDFIEYFSLAKEVLDEIIREISTNLPDYKVEGEL